MLEVLNWGLIDYQEALRQQEELVQKTYQEKLEGFLIFCTHPPVVTLGRKTQEGDVFSWTGPLIEIARGGRATYHGPSQLVVYMIYNMDFPRRDYPVRDIGWFLRGFENAIVQTLAQYHLSAVGKSLQKKAPESTDSTEETGVWVGPRKIASLGIGIRKWVTFHGAAINLENDPTAFQGLKPCGFQKETMLSLEEALGRRVSREEFQHQLQKQLMSFFQN